VPTIAYHLCDVFADGPLSGNQLAVVEAGEPLPEADLQAVAKEFGFSETTFLGAPNEDGSVPFRIFTPSVELRFAGHPTLGSAAVAARDGRRTGIVLECAVGAIETTLEWIAENAVDVSMVQPNPVISPYQAPDALFAALGIDGSVLPVELYDNGMTYVVVGLADEGAVAALRPDFAALAELTAVSGVNAGVSCVAGSGCRFKTRMFAPGFGVAEDPATGSAAGPLACHLARHGRTRWGEDIEIHQGTEIGRRSILRATAFGSASGIDEVWVAGEVDLLGRGELTWSPVSRP